MGLADNFTKKKTKAKTATKAAKPVTLKAQGRKKVAKAKTPTKKGKTGKATTPAKAGKKAKGKKAGEAAKKNTATKGKKAKAVEKEKPKTAEELDEEMAMYWFKAGKGPDPAVLKLDKEMEAYAAEKASKKE